CSYSCFFLNDTATTEIYTLSLHDALPILPRACTTSGTVMVLADKVRLYEPDRKSTRLNSSHTVISYAVFCVKKKINTAPGPPFAPAAPDVPFLRWRCARA